MKIVYYFGNLVFIDPVIDEEKKKQELTTFSRYVKTLRKLLNDFKHQEHQTKFPVRDISRKFSLFNKMSTFHYNRMETSSPENKKPLKKIENGKK